MNIHVRLYASFADKLPTRTKGEGHPMEVEPHTTVNDLLLKLDLPPQLSKIVFLNGVHAHGNEEFKEGDRLAVFPPVAGG